MMRRTEWMALALLVAVMGSAGALVAQTTTTTTTGTAQELGSITHFNFQSSDGSRTHGTLQELGSFGYWDLTTAEPAHPGSNPFSALLGDE